MCQHLDRVLTSSVAPLSATSSMNACQPCSQARAGCGHEGSVIGPPIFLVWLELRRLPQILVGSSFYKLSNTCTAPMLDLARTQEKLPFSGPCSSQTLKSDNKDPAAFER